MKGPTPPGGRCANCGAQLAGPYCASCGQRNDPLQQPASHFVREAVAEYLDLDGRLWRTLGALLFRPGHLTVEYNAGRRQRYLRPFRLYLTATVLFFFALAVTDPVRDVRIDGGSAPSDTLVRAADRAAELEQTMESVGAALQSLQGPGPAAGDTGRVPALLARELRSLSVERAALAALPGDSLVRAGAATPDSVRRDQDVDGAGLLAALPEWLKGPSVRRLESARTPAERREAKSDLARAVIARIPTAMFLLLPVFAGILKLLYLSGGGLRRPHRRSRRRGRSARRRQRRPWRRVARALWSAAPASLRMRRRAALRRQLSAKRTRFLSEHLVFTLHVHAFAFVVFLAILLLDEVGDVPAAQRSVVLLAWAVPAYFLLAQKRVYAQRWPKTILKATALGTLYGVALVFGGLFALALAATLG